MSQGAHHPTSGDYDRLPPARTTAGLGGIPAGAMLLVLAGILCSIMQGSFVASTAHWGRVWPSIDSTKIELPPQTF